MKRLDLKDFIKTFKVGRITIMNELKDKKSIFYLPDDFICYVGDDGNAESFEKFEANFTEIQDKEYFSVCVDDMLYIDKNYTLTDDETKKAYFGKTARGKKGDKEYASIHMRVAAVYSALCMGKIKIGEINVVED